MPSQLRYLHRQLRVGPGVHDPFSSASLSIQRGSTIPEERRVMFVHLHAHREFGLAQECVNANSCLESDGDADTLKMGCYRRNPRNGSML